MSLLDSSLIVSVVLGLLLLVFVRVLGRRFGENAADGVILGTAFLELWVLGIGLILNGSFGPVTIGATAILAWMLVAYITFRIAVATHSFPDEDFPIAQCVPKKTYGTEKDLTKESGSNFTRLWSRFRCVPTDTDLHLSIRARRIRFWGAFWESDRIRLRHDTSILCDAACKAGADHTGTYEEGGDVLRAVLYLTQIQVGQYVEIEVKMFTAMGAARVVFSGSATLQGSTGQTTGGTTTVAPGTTISTSSTTGASGSVTGGATVTFPDASQVVKFDGGFYQWQCVPPAGEAVFRLDLGDLASTTIDQGGTSVDQEGASGLTELDLRTLVHCDWDRLDPGDGNPHEWFITFVGVISVYPAPANAKLDIQFDSGQTSIQKGVRIRIVSRTCQIHVDSRDGDLGNVIVEQIR